MKVIAILEQEVNRMLAGNQAARRERGTDAIIKEFLGYIASRAGLLIPRGLDSQGTLYAFTHLSFLEYFAARYLQDRRADDLKREQALRRKRTTTEQWARTHLHDPLSITADNYRQWPTQTAWHEVLVFLAESSQDNDDDLLDLLQALFPPLCGGEEPEYPPIIRDQVPDAWQPLVPEDAVDLALRLLRDRHLQLAPPDPARPGENLPDRQATAGQWLERLWKAWMRIRCWKDNHPWWIAPRLLADDHLRPLAELALYRALAGDSEPVSLNLFKSESLSVLPPLPQSLELLSLRGRTALKTLPALPEKLQRLSLHDCPELAELPTLPKPLREIDLTGCKGLAELPALPENLERLYLNGCTGLSALPALPRDLQALWVNDCVLGVKAAVLRLKDERPALEIGGL